MSRVACIVIALAEVACATAYQPHGLSGGYSETQLGENVFRVAFEGNGYTSVVRAADLALLRSADVALEHGYGYFIMASDSSVATASGGSVKGSGVVTSQPSTINTVVCFKERPAGAALVYEAKTVRAALRARYDLDEVDRQRSAPARTRPIDPFAPDDR
jgi:hypothetical protein